MLNPFHEKDTTGGYRRVTMVLSANSCTDLKSGILAAMGNAVLGVWRGAARVTIGSAKAQESVVRQDAAPEAPSYPVSTRTNDTSRRIACSTTLVSSWRTT